MFKVPPETTSCFVGVSLEEEEDEDEDEDEELGEDEEDEEEEDDDDEEVDDEEEKDDDDEEVEEEEEEEDDDDDDDDEEEDEDEDEELGEEAAVGGCLGLVGALRSCIGSYSTPVFGSLIMRTLLGCGIGVLCKGIDLGGPASGIP